MSIAQVLSQDERTKLSQSDRNYLNRKLNERCTLNALLHRPINQLMLHQLQCLLDKQPIPRQKSGQFVRGQITRLSDGVRRPCTVRKMTDEERIKYGLEVTP